MDILTTDARLAAEPASWLTSLAAPQWISDMLASDGLRWTLTLAYVLVLLVIAVYGLHRYWLVYLYYRHRRNIARPQARFQTLPRLTVQLPMFNEASVSQRIIAAACELDYPRDLLQIQVLDDSTDHSRDIARQAVEAYQAKGFDIQYIHRTNRAGFKAGAMAQAMDRVTGRFIAIFDADFIPPANFLKRTIHYFTNEKVGMVQTRWAHLNRDDSLLTRCQAIFLDGHFVIEHTARNRAGCWINFNGTAGLWRKDAITTAGGWQGDTLTEDVDLSYRAQMKGWRFVYAPHIVCPAELPPHVNAFKSQQHRWTKGTLQTAMKLLGRIMHADAPLSVRKEAFFHLTCPIVYPCVCLMVLLFYPAFFVNMQPFGDGTVAGAIWGLMLFALGTLSAGVFYLASQRAQKRSLLATAMYLPVLMGIGIGIAVNNARGCIEAMLGHESPFVRTPKYNTLPVGRHGRHQACDASEDNTRLEEASGEQQRNTPKRRFGWRAHKLMPVFEIGMGLYTVECIRLAMIYDNTQMSLPFLVIFAAGYFAIGFASLWQTATQALAARRMAAAEAIAQPKALAEPAA